MLVNPFYVLYEANKNNYAISAFNVMNLETLKGVVQAALKQTKPVIIQVSSSALKWAQFDYLIPMVKTVLEKSKHPFILHLDHCQDLDQLQKAIDYGFNSVMFDGSHFSFEKNVELSNQAAKICQKHNVFLELEIGVIGGKEDDLQADQPITCKLDDVLNFYEQTQCNSLAVAFGTSHGIYKRPAKLDFNLLKKAKQKLNIPLVMHGTSGISDLDILKSVKLGINKVNLATDLLVVYCEAVKDYFAKHPKSYDLRKINSFGIDAIENKVSHYLKLLE